MWSDPLLVILFVLDLFVALTATGGGIAIVAGLERSNFPSSWLEGTPFRSYTVPGLLLAVVVGGSAVAAIIAVALDAFAGTIASLIAGAVLVGWIAGEIRLLNTPGVSRTEIVYLAVGLAMITVSAIVLVS